MIKKTVFIYLFISLFIIGVTSQTKESFLEYYNNEIITITCPLGSSLNLNVNGITSSIGFKISPLITERIISYPTSKELFIEYQKQYKNGNIQLWSGFSGLIIGSTIFALYNSDSNDIKSIGDPVNIASISGMTIGLIIELIGAMKINMSQESLFNAINLYNKEKIKEYSLK
jgi:hypothetical protein